MTVFEQLYRGGQPQPWDHAGPAAFVVDLVRAGQVRGAVLDAGCGSGENALYLAAHGYHVWGVDSAPTAIERARAKARERGLDVRFVLADACELADLEDRFDTVLDCGLFHVLGDDDQARYVRAVHRATRPAACLHLLCFSDHNPPPPGPAPVGCLTHGVSQAELRAAFAVGWTIESIESSLARLAAPDGTEREVRFWQARIRRDAPAA